MATLMSTTVVPSNNTDANFRAWASFVHNVFLLGWVNTADTGQIDLTTVTAPVGANTKQGYKIYRMDDALQATEPVFVRIDFGSGPTAAVPGAWLTIGKGSDGVGNITSILYNGGISATPNMSAGASSTAAHNSYGSADTNRVSIGLFCAAGALRNIPFFIERSKDSNGDDTNDAIVFATGTSGIMSLSQYLKYTGPLPPQDLCLNALLPSQNPGSFGSDIGVGVHIPFAGVAMYPSIGMVVVRAADFASEAGFSMTIYGVSRTYQHLANASNRYPNGVITGDTNSRICILYE